MTTIPINTTTLKPIFYTFSVDVIGDSPVTNQEQISLFINTLTSNPELQHNPDENTLTFHNKTYDISSPHYTRFASTYGHNSYTSQQIDDLIEIADTLIEDMDRRFTGDFWTPKIWVSHSHTIIENALGENWKEDYVVWDMASGGKNLTRNHTFTELYSSTLHAEELHISSNYNTENIAFQFDFLNDDIDLHATSLEDIKNNPHRYRIPEPLLHALIDKKPIVFYANPPYGQATSELGKSHKDSISNTEMSELMNNLGWGRKELYTQFLYRVQLLAELFEYEKDFHIFFFTKAKFLPSPSFFRFNERFTEKFCYRGGFIMNAGEFSDTTGIWPIAFSHWSVEGEKDQREFLFDVCESTPEKNIVSTGTWNAVMVSKEDTDTAWLREIDTCLTAVDAPQTRNGFDAPTVSKTYKSATAGLLGSFINKSPNLQSSEKYCVMLSMMYQGAGCYRVDEHNVERAAVVYAIRKAVFDRRVSEGTRWIHNEDVFSRPQESILSDEFISDCVVYSLFAAHSFQTSLRDYSYGGGTYDVWNHFFPFSRGEIRKLAQRCNNSDILADLSRDDDKERFIHLWLESHQEHLSTSAQELLDYAYTLYEDSFAMRVRYKSSMPVREERYQVNTWDAGWIQVNKMIFSRDRLDDSMLDRKEEWMSKVRALGNKIADQVI